MNILRTAILLTVLTLGLVFVGGMIGGRGGALFALIMASVINMGSYWFSDKIVIKMYKGNQVTSGPLFDVVTEICQINQLPMPKVYTLPQATPNAFATGRNPEHAVVAATEGITQVLSRDELKGVMAHEMSHVMHRDILIGSIAATIAGAIAYLAHMAQWAAIFGGFGRDEEDSNPLALIVLAIIAPMAAMLIQMAISRSREFEADKGGAQLCGNPLFLANALRKLENANESAPMPRVNEATAHMFIVNPLRGGGGVKALFTTHPPMAERIRRLEEMAQ
ncbi:MAG: zinc metalloprotease HtpX [Desulfuromonadales bacterium]|jgi:heat shock protein HtpX|nr:zinc metalloprotease HtpX [Desulfuromonadales bacterium]MDH3808788.1 zinc metalloprotease HtpX [Desulfuromonadales bacterium]MDH4025150.1 zinc metalloprotease HtpX [Desulfuromonadales bacterium]